MAERRGNAFLTPEWFTCWLRHYGGEDTTLVAGLRHSDRSLRGLLPLSLEPGRIGVAEFAGGHLGDLFCPVCEARDEEEAAAAAGVALAARDSSGESLRSGTWTASGPGLRAWPTRPGRA